MTRAAAADLWAKLPLAARIEAWRKTILETGYKPHARLTHVYCVQEGVDGPIKIGRANNVKGRLASMQSGNHRRLHLLASALLPRQLEKELHYELADYRIGRSEWFEPVEAVMEAVGVLAGYAADGREPPFPAKPHDDTDGDQPPLEGPPFDAQRRA